MSENKEQSTEELFDAFVRERDGLNNPVEDTMADEEPPAKEERVFTEIEKEALSKGWKPDGPRGAEDYLFVGQLSDEIKARGKELKALRQEVERAKQVGYAQALQDLKAKRREAIEDGEVELVESYDTRLAEIQQELNTAKEAAPDEMAEAIKHFEAKNASWIVDPSFEAAQMREFAKSYHDYLFAFNLDPKEHFKQLNEQLAARFPERFAEKEIPKAPAVEAHLEPRAPSTARIHKPISELSDGEKMVYNYYLADKKGGKEKAKQYLIDLAKMEA